MNTKNAIVGTTIVFIGAVLATATVSAFMVNDKFRITDKVSDRVKRSINDAKNFKSQFSI